MLRRLRIEHIALVDSCEIDLDPGFNVITGETGSGKSIFLTAIGLLLGEKAEPETIRHGESFAFVEAVFDVSKDVLSFFAEFEIDGDTCTLRRELFLNGKSRGFINGHLVTIGSLKRLGKVLVEVSSQHAHLKLKDKEALRHIIDAYGGHEHLTKQFHECYEQQLVFSKQLLSWNQEEPYRAHEIERLKKSLLDIEQSQIFTVNDDELFSRLQTLEKEKTLFETASTLVSDLEHGKPPLQTQLFRILQRTQKLAEINPSWSAIAEHVGQACSSLTEATNELTQKLASLEYSEDERSRLDTTLSHIHAIKRQYPGQLREIAEQYSLMKATLLSLEARDEQRLELEEQIVTNATTCDHLAHELHQCRTKAAHNMARAIENQLHHLNMPHASVTIQVTKTARSASGDDYIQCFLTPNIGEKQLELHENASGGELARVYLSIQAIMAEFFAVPTILFDEVDANIGGITANMVGTALANIGKKRQVLAVTHFVQVTTKADAHFVLNKNTLDGRTISSVQRLNTDEALIQERSRMVGK